MMTYFKNLFFIFCFGISLGQEIDSTSVIESTFDVESVSIENFKEKHFLDSTFKCNESKNQLKNVRFLNLELLLPEQDSIYVDVFQGNPQLHSIKTLKDNLSFGLFKSYDKVESNKLFKVFQEILINDVFSGQALDFGVFNLVNLNKVYWIKSDYSTNEVAYFVLIILFEDVSRENIFMIKLDDSSSDLNKAICKYYPSIQSIVFKNP
jgi:hypothetical protein